MTQKWLQKLKARRSFLTRLAAGAGALGAAAVGSPSAIAAQVGKDQSWRAARHAQDDWYDQIPGVHRFVFDTTSAANLALALRFANNYFNVNQSAYGLKESDLAVLMILRDKSTEFGYNDAMWAKYGKQFSEHAQFTDPKIKQPPTLNLYTARAEASDPGPLAALIKKGAHFGVCSTATRGIATRISQAGGGDIDAIIKELGANLICANARFVPAGIVAVNRAQEYGYSFVNGA